MYINGWVDIKSYQQTCHDNGHDFAEKKCVFIFPGNSGHHTACTTLFSVKDGGGLAKVAGDLGQAGYPTLSMPTTSLGNWENDSRLKGIAQRAIEDLYKACGAGYQLMLPVRAHDNNDYFDNGLFPGTNLEPSFWGSIELTPNKPLANYYTRQLDNLFRFMALSQESRDKKTEADPENPFYHAYTQGQNMSEDDPWLQPAKPMNVSPSPVRASQSVHGLFHDKSKEELSFARAVLNDYTKNNSALRRFFTGHWNRHHVVEVNALVVQIDQGKINTAADLLQKLKEIQLVNPNGSLARRISLIERRNPSSENESAYKLSSF
jgi:hypothetical protein